MVVANVDTQNLKNIKAWCWAELSQNGWDWDVGCLLRSVLYFQCIIST